MLGMVVKGLDRPEELIGVARGPGKRHVDYGVKDEHYATVAEALLWTLQKGLGGDFTDEVRESWTAACAFLAKEMQSAK